MRNGKIIVFSLHLFSVLNKDYLITIFVILPYVAETTIKTGNTTLTDLQNTIKEWLRHAGDRVRYQQKKRVNSDDKS